MKTEVYIYNLNGNRAAVRDYANTIASMSASNCNAYVMAFDKDNEILWTVQAGDDLDEVKAAINWQGVRRVEIYDHSADCTYKTEQVYITSRISLNGYTSERSASEFVVVDNTTQYTADNWQKTEADESDNSDDNSDGNSDGNNEGNQTPAEPSRLAQAAASVKAYAVNGAKRFAFLLSMLAVFVLTLVVAFGPVVIIGTLFDVLGITGFARPLLAMVILLWPSLELAINVECNAVALVSRLFPDYLRNSMPFGSFSFWGRMLCA